MQYYLQIQYYKFVYILGNITKYIHLKKYHGHVFQNFWETKKKKKTCIPVAGAWLKSFSYNSDRNRNLEIMAFGSMYSDTEKERSVVYIALYHYTITESFQIPAAISSSFNSYAIAVQFGNKHDLLATEKKKPRNEHTSYHEA